MAAPGAPSQLPLSTPGAPSGSSPNRHATALLVNTLTFATGEDVPAWLRRNGLTDAARSGLVLEHVTDFGMPFADRHGRFNGVTFALLDIVLPLGMNLPFADGLEFAPSQSRIAPGVFFQQRYIQAWETRLHFTTELPLARAGWPLPLTRVLACLAPEQHNAVLGVLRTAVDLKCAALSGRGLDEQSLKHHWRTWRKLQALVQAISLRNRPDAPRASTAIAPLHWANPCELDHQDICRTATGPSVWLGNCCEATGIWVLRPGLPVPPAQWIPTVLHAVKARLMATLLSQRAVPLNRMLRGHVSPKMADVFWLSCSATLDDAPPPPSASAEHGTWRHCLMWRITIHQLRALPGSSVALDIWQAGTLHILVRAPRTRSGSGRMTFAPAAEDFGETLVLVLDYAGPAITAFMTLEGSDAKLRGPVLDPSAPPDDALMTNSLRDVFYPDFLVNLPPALQIIDQEQRAILSNIAQSDAPVQIIHALAGCGKSAILQCIVALYARRHAGLDLEAASSEVLVLTLRTRTLRHEFLQALLHHHILMPDRVIFGGRLPDRLLEAGVLDDDVAHMERIILAQLGVRAPLEEYELSRVALEARHQAVVDAHTADSWAETGEVVVLKLLAKTALDKLWAFHQAYADGEAAAFAKVAVVLVTTDVALKIFGKAAASGSPAARLLRKKRPVAIIMDEVQRCPVETYVALGSQAPTVIAVGDRGQELYPLIAWHAQSASSLQLQV